MIIVAIHLTPDIDSMSTVKYRRIYNKLHGEEREQASPVEPCKKLSRCLTHVYNSQCYKNGVSNSTHKKENIYSECALQVARCSSCAKQLSLACGQDCQAPIKERSLAMFFTIECDRDFELLPYRVQSIT